MKRKNRSTARIAFCLPQSLHDKLGAWPQAEDRALSNLIYGFVKQAVAEREGAVPSHSFKEDTVNESA